MVIVRRCGFGENGVKSRVFRQKNVKKHVFPSFLANEWFPSKVVKQKLLIFLSFLEICAYCQDRRHQISAKNNMQIYANEPKTYINSFHAPRGLRNEVWSDFEIFHFAVPPLFDPYGERVLNGLATQIGHRVWTSIVKTTVLSKAVLDIAESVS